MDIVDHVRKLIALAESTHSVEEARTAARDGDVVLPHTLASSGAPRLGLSSTH